jgi:hypothetical protein
VIVAAHSGDDFSAAKEDFWDFQEMLRRILS